MSEDVDTVETPAYEIARQFAHGDEALAEAIRVAMRAAILATQEKCAQVADAEAKRRHENYLACKAGSQEWGFPDDAAMAQGHKHVTALEIASAIRSLKLTEPPHE